MSTNLIAQEDPIVEKIKNIKELFEMNVISKKEYDSITNILVNDLLNKETKSITKPPEQVKSIPSRQNVQYDIETDVNNNFNQLKEEEYIPFIDDSWGLRFGYSFISGNVSAYSLQEDFKANGWSLGLTNRWGIAGNIQWQATFRYGQSKITEYKLDGITLTSSDFEDYDIDVTSSGLSISLESLLYFNPTTYFSAGLGISHGLDGKTDGVKELNLSAGVGLGFDVDDTLSFELGYSRNITNPYRGGQYSDIKFYQGSFGLSTIIRF